MFYNEAFLSYLCYQPLHRGYRCLVWPSAKPTWVVGGVSRTSWIFNRGLVYHPDPWEYVYGPFIFRRCMVRNLWFFILMASRPLSLIVPLRFRRVCCASSSLGVPGAISWRILGVPWSPFHQLHRLFIFHWRPRSVFSERYWANLFGVSLTFLGAVSKRIPGTPWRDCLTLSFSLWYSSPGDIDDLANHLVLVLLLVIGWFPRPLCRISAWITDFSAQISCMTQIYWCLFLTYI